MNNHNANAPSNHENPICYLSRAFNQPFPTISLKCVWSKEIENITKSFEIKNLHGYDAMSRKILKLRIHYIFSPLTYICNKMLSSGIFPTRLKFSEVKPIFKRGNKNDTSNYRPVSLLTLFSKIFESLFIIIDCIIILIIITFFLINNSVSGIHQQQTLRPIHWPRIYWQH